MRSVDRNAQVLPFFPTLCLIFIATTIATNACTGCEFQRMLFWGPKVAALKLLGVIVFTIPRLDTFRVSYSFLAYLCFYFQAYKYAISYAHPLNEGFTGVIGNITLALLELNVFDAGVIFIMGALPFFRRHKDQGVFWWQPIGYAVALCCARRFV